MARPGRNVLIRGRWYGPSYPDAGTPPTSTAVSTPPRAPQPTPITPDPEPAPADPGPGMEREPELAAGVDAPAPPPRYGKGSGNAAWRDWAHAVGIDLTAIGNDDARRDQILAAARAAGILTDS